MFTQEECELIRRLADGVTPMVWLAVGCRSMKEHNEAVMVTLQYRDPNPNVADREIDVCIVSPKLRNKKGLAEYLRGALNSCIQAEGVNS